MQTIGILGGMAPESTVEYYRQIIQASHEHGWEKRYPRTIILSQNFEEFYDPLSAGDDEQVLEVLSAGLESLAAAGADFVLLASNTPHKFYKDLLEDSPLPILSIVDATAEAAVERGFERVGVLGTLHTTNGDFYPEGFAAHDLEVCTPDQEDKEWTHEKIFGELTSGVHTAETKADLVEIVEKMVEEQGIDAVALACTELPLILDESDLPVPILNTTSLHARYAFDEAIQS
jgi:aspartate racemase